MIGLRPIKGAPLNTVFLLGSGASAEAGVPMSTEMTEAIVKQLADGPARYGPVAQALNYAVGALVAHDTSLGTSPYAGIDVERLFAAVQMLSDRDALEVTPFVSAWSSTLESLVFDGSLPAIDEPLQDALFNEAAFNSVRELMLNFLKAARMRSATDETFRLLSVEMIHALRDLVRVDAVSVEYLAPLLDVKRDGPLKIATLNYDRSIEELCDLSGVRCDRGIEAWTGGHEWTWNGSSEVQLLKLHGSIDWFTEQRVGPGYLPEPSIRVASGDVDSRHVGQSPALVFGARGKLTPDGPFLAMLREFDAFLSSADHLVVVGYSFRDEHINVAVRRWLNHDNDVRLTVIDPFFSDVPGWTHSSVAMPFRETLRRAMLDHSGPPHPEKWSPRFQVLQVPASSGLPYLVG